MNDKQRSDLISAIIIALDEAVKRRNSQQMYELNQLPRPGGDIAIRLAFMSDEQLIKISKLCGI